MGRLRRAAALTVYKRPPTAYKRPLTLAVAGREVGLERGRLDGHVEHVFDVLVFGDAHRRVDRFRLYRLEAVVFVRHREERDGLAEQLADLLAEFELDIEG